MYLNFRRLRTMTLVPGEAWQFGPLRASRQWTHVMIDAFVTCVVRAVLPILLGAVAVPAIAQTEVAIDTKPVSVQQSYWVERSDETIGDGFLTWATLPRRVSLNAMTASEIKQLKIDAYRSGASCMQWFFLKRGREMLPIGAALGRGQGVVKLNGVFRSAEFLGHGVAIFQFDRLPSLAARPPAGIAGPETQVGLVLGASSKLAVARYSGMCTLIKARCRRYTATGIKGHWVARNPHNASLDERPLAVEVPANATFVTEDMCPMTQSALIDTPWKSRLWGDRPGVMLNGFVLQRSLRSALADVAKEAEMGATE